MANYLFFIKILLKIEQELKGKEAGIIKINFPAEELSNLDVREFIHLHFNAEIIGDNLFIKYNCPLKEDLDHELANSLERKTQGWYISVNNICVINDRELRCDVGVWFQRPTFAQMQRPITYSCPSSNVWIEVFDNIDSDRNYALNNINWLQQNTIGIEFVAIAFPGSPFHSNPDPQMITTHATSQHTQPTKAPYVCHWDISNNEIWYQMDWNHHITLRCDLIIDFNVILNTLIE
ncbi:940_t:CDS:2 [Diversispora eburnea]|uniref:940_t:CDS:1 n=1 Tax=Diversispora eburnea TaxID=1213867 RepID=A0A9N9AT50_9GLOM|nr:940_t:CDS:2 [Diversispora eburnea]